MALKAEGHYGSPKVNAYSILLHATLNLFINWLLGLTLIPRFNQAIKGFTRPLWTLLGHYGWAMLHPSYSIDLLGHK